MYYVSQNFEVRCVSTETNQDNGFEMQEKDKESKNTHEFESK